MGTKKGRASKGSAFFISMPEGDLRVSLTQLNLEKERNCLFYRNSALLQILHFAASLRLWTQLLM
jgi:hypothetical protein